MAKIVINGLCGGTQTKQKRDGTGSYTVTSFVDLDTMKPIDIFGELNLPASKVPQEYVLSAELDRVRNVVVVSVGASEPATPAKK